MKKKSLLLAIAAMSMAAVGVGTVGTFAWYKATQASINGEAATASVSTVNGVESLGSFNVKAVVTNASLPTPKLSDASGNTYMWNGTSNTPATDAGTAMVEFTFKFEITYSGALTQESDIEAEWTTAVGSNKAYLTAEDFSVATGSTLTDGQKTRYNALKTHAETLTSPKNTQYGLKFAASSTDYDNVGSQDIEVKSNNNIKTIDFNGQTKVEVVVGSVYVGVWGIDGIEQKADDAYLAKFTPKFAA